MIPQTDPPHANPDHTAAHLEALLTHAPPDHGLVLSGYRQGGGRLGRLADWLVTPDRVTEATELVHAKGPGWHTYTSTCLLSADSWATVLASGSAGARGGGAHVGAVTHLWVDLDVAGPNHKADNLPPTTADAMAMIRPMPTPTMVVSTGGGLHAYWQLRAPVVIVDDETRTQAAALTGGWSAVAETLGTAKGWHVDPVGDLARVLRLAGTSNPKTNPPGVAAMSDLTGAPVRLWAPGPTYPVDELAAIIHERVTIPTERAARARAAATPMAATHSPTRTRRPSTPGADELRILDALETLPWDDVLPADWYRPTHPTGGGPMTERLGSDTAELWNHPLATSTPSAKCTPGVAIVWSSSIPGLPPGNYNRAQILAWSLYGSPDERSRLATHMTQRRANKQRNRR